MTIFHIHTKMSVLIKCTTGISFEHLLKIHDAVKLSESFLHAPVTDQLLITRIIICAMIVVAEQQGLVS